MPRPRRKLAVENVGLIVTREVPMEVAFAGPSQPVPPPPYNPTQPLPPPPKSMDI